MMSAALTWRNWRNMLASRVPHQPDISNYVACWLEYCMLLPIIFSSQ